MARLLFRRRNGWILAVRLPRRCIYAPMRVLVTGSAGHLGEGLVRTLRERGHDAVGLDRLESPFTAHVGSIGDRELLRAALRGIDVVVHAAALHKPHMATHSP